MKAKILPKIYDLIPALIIFLFPLVILPSFLDPFDTGKQVFLLVSVFILFVFWVIKSFFQKKLVIAKNPYTLSITLFAIILLVSSLVNPISKIASLSSTNGPITIILMILFILLAGNLSKGKLAFYSLLASGGVLSVINLILFLGKFTFPININFLGLSIAKSFSLTGSIISQVIFLMALIPIGFALVYEAVKENKMPAAAVLSFVNVLILSSLGIGVYLLGSEAKPILLPQATAWAIAIESLKEAKLALWGVGPGRFLQAFSVFKPISYNSTDLWNLRFNASSNWYFQLLTEIGIVGLIVYFNLVWRILKNSLLALRKNKVAVMNLAVHISLILVLIAQLFVPLNIVLVIAFFVLLALTEGNGQTEIDIAPLGNLSLVFLIFPLCIWAAVFFFGGKILLANITFVNSIRAANQNDGVKTYNLQIKAIDTDKNNPTYRIAYSQTNLALANSLATKKDLTDQDRSTISQLVQQAIREAKSAVTIDPSSITAWENLSSVYQTLINFAQGADQWAVASYEETINRDPFSPRLRIELGGIFYGQKNYDQAITYFLQATNLKSDWALAHYNLANALRERGALVDAKREYEITQGLVKIDSADYQKVTQELEDVKKRLPAQQAQAPAQPETLKVPEKPKEIIKPPLTLPEEGSPPVTQVSPSPTPENP